MSPSGDLNLLYTDIEDSLRSSIRDLLTDRCPPSSVVPVYDGDRSLQPALWRALATDLGLAGLLVPEERGGAGASAREAAVALEELGRFVAPVPFLTSSVVATTALLAGTGAREVPGVRTAGPSGSGAVASTSSGDTGGAIGSLGPGGPDSSGVGAPAPAAEELLAALAAGERTAALAVPFSTSVTSFRAVVREYGDGKLQGSVTSVAGALDADVLLVPVVTDLGAELHVVDASAVAIEPATSLDMTRQLADVALSGATSTAVVPVGVADPAVREALWVGSALMTSEQLGVAQWCLDATVGYLKERRQFGRVVGGFQALKHRLANLYVQVESARAVARYAAAAFAEDDEDREVAAVLAQVYCSDVAVKAAEECVQLHGGIGMTWEHPAHLYLKRAKADQIAFGSSGAHRRELSEMVGLPVS
jgi:alkylation response protein AidB-like acyl-CoA dehydrogenase